MGRFQIFLLRVCLFLALYSACLAAVTPRKQLSLAAVKRIKKYAPHFSQNVSHVHKTATAPSNYLSKAPPKHFTSPLLQSLNVDMKTRTNRLGTTVDVIPARTAALKVTSRQSGLNLDPCSDNSDCASSRLCVVNGDNGFAPCDSSEGCVCLPESPDDLVCTSDSDCDDGESCIAVGSDIFCASDDVIEQQNPGNSPASPSSGSGLSFDPCSDPSDCASSRLCFLIGEDGTVPCDSSEGCVCLPESPDDLFCTSDSDCDSGESCGDVRLNSRPICASIAAGDVASSSGSESDPGSASGDEGSGSGTSSSGGGSASGGEEGNSSSEQPGSDSDSSSSDSSSSSGTGLSFDSCSDASDCAGSRVCLEISEEVTSTTGAACTPDAECRCIKAASFDCDSDSACDNGETCLEVDEGRVCTSESGAAFVQEASVCIGSESLTNFAREELVFDQDALAHVLCDMNESCATPGHMVVYRGEALMMKNYCKVVGCTRRVKQVNSPKYTRKLSIPSKTQDLVFTAFAARFGTLAEEGVLSTAVRLGF